MNQLDRAFEVQVSPPPRSLFCLFFFTFSSPVPTESIYRWYIIGCFQTYSSIALFWTSEWVGKLVGLAHFHTSFWLREPFSSNLQSCSRSDQTAPGFVCDWTPKGSLCSCFGPTMIVLFSSAQMNHTEDENQPEHHSTETTLEWKRPESKTNLLIRRQKTTSSFWSLLIFWYF